MTVKWTVGGGLDSAEIIGAVIDQQFSIGVKPSELINTVYDSTLGLKWNGGRIGTHAQTGGVIQQGIVKFWNNNGIGFNTAFNNTLLEEKHMEDDDCNWWLEQCYRPGNGVIIASDALRDHVKSQFPDYKLIASTCRVKHTIEEYKQAQKDYDLVVLLPDLNRNRKFMKELDMDRLEVPVDEWCAMNCSRRQTCYNEISEYHLKGNVFIRDQAAGCLTESDKSRERGKMILNLVEIEELEQFGISHFKLIGGRNHPVANRYETIVDNVVRLREYYTTRDAIKAAAESA